ncbi:hypothetical protein D9M72_512580 [compost metagenome]
MLAFGVLAGAYQRHRAAFGRHVARAQVLEVIGVGIQQLHHVVPVALWVALRQRRHAQRDRSVGQVGPAAEVQQVIGGRDDVAVFMRPLALARRQRIDRGAAIAGGLADRGLHLAGTDRLDQRIAVDHQRDGGGGGQRFLAGAVDGCGEQLWRGMVHARAPKNVKKHGNR